jgi:gamma-glutamyltranspeptidase/glutathione hydrolase
VNADAIAAVEAAFRSRADGKTAAAEDGMVATASPEATQAGVEMLEAGGNAVDAACAVGFALGVCEPQMSGLGGQTLGLLHIDGKTLAIDGSSRVPSLAHRSRVDREQVLLGYRAATVPSTPAALGWLHRRYARLPWVEVLRPAIRIAREGYSITPLEHDLQRRELKNFLSVPSRSGARFFIKEGQWPYDPGDRFRQPELADTLEQLARHGVRDFYQGGIAARIDEDMRRNDGFLRADDLALIPWPVQRMPIRRPYRGLSVATMPPPGSGRTLLLTLIMLQHIAPAFLRSERQEKHHFIAESFRKAFMQRTERPFDPNTYPQIRDKRMLSASFARQLAGSIAETTDAELPVDPPGVTVSDLDDETTHFSVMDAEGNVASITQSIELAYGSRAAAEGLGFLYNNYMAALEFENPQHPYYLRPNAVPWSAAAPTIVFRDQQPWIAMGSPGSERIYSSLAQFLVQVADHEHPIDDAMLAPRLHCSIGGTISLEAERFPAEVIDYLERQGYRIDRRAAYSFALGCVQAVLKCQSRDGFQGVADIRREGTAAGPA